MNLTNILALIQTHAWIALAWMALTGTINTVFQWKTPAELDAFAERSPVLAKLAAICRHWGIDPIAGLRVIAGFFASNPPPPSDDDPPPPASVVAPLPADIPTKRDVAIPLATAACLVISGCSLFTPKNVHTALDDADKVCILEHEILDEPTIEVVCKIEHALAPGIEQVLEEHRQAIARDRATMATRAPDAGRAR
jgi:hypothetical protein